MKALSALQAEQSHRFADDIDGLARKEEELANLVERLDKASIAYGMNGQKLETVTSFKYLGSVIIDEGSKSKIHFRTADNSSTDKAETNLD